MSEDQKISNLEKEMIQLKGSVEFQSKILKDVKEILHEHKNILQGMLLLRDNVEEVKKDVAYLERIFESRKEVTDTNNKNFSDFVSKTKGVLAACVVFFGIVQGSVAFVLSDNYETHKNFQKEFQELKIENAIIKEKIRLQSLDKNVSRIIEESKTTQN